jgi:hypothetical protein
VEPHSNQPDGSPPREPATPQITLADRLQAAALMAGMTGDLSLAVRRVNELIARLEAPGWVVSDLTSWEEGLKFITGQSRPDRALESFQKAFGQPKYIQMPLCTPAGAIIPCCRSLEEIRASGFIAQELEELKALFEAQKSRKKNSKHFPLHTANAKTLEPAVEKTEPAAKRGGRATKKDGQSAKKAG